jgi:3-hydroxyisobutyrate dehydrogenase
MGLPVCRRLVAAGYGVTAVDVRADRREAARAAGAAIAADPAVVAPRVDVVVTVLPGSPELSQLMPGVISEAPPRATATSTWTWIDLTSASPLAAAPLREAALARGLECLEAPMGGGPSAAEAGSLQLYVGGPEAVVLRHRRLLESLGRVVHVGGHDAGYTVKLLVNLLWFGQALATGEALLLARRTGLDLDVVRGALADSAAAGRFLKQDVDALLDGDYLTTFGIDRCVEELDAVVAMAAEHDLPFELSTVVRDLYTRALVRYGPVDGELLSVALLEEQAGTELRRAP